MSIGLYSHTTRGTGTVLTAAIYNSDHQNHITNQNPSMTGGHSDDVAQMQLTTDPGGVGSESLAASLAAELERLRFAIQRITGGTRWYEAPVADLATLDATVSGGQLDELSVANELTPAQITADQNDYAPTGHADTFLFRLSSDAIRNITGLQGGTAGRIVCLTNVGSNGIQILNEDAGSIAANRIAIGTQGPILLSINESVLLRYDATSSRWRPMHSADLGFPSFGGITCTAYADFNENASPGNPPANTARMYAFDDGSVTKMAYRDSAGTVTLFGPADVQEFTSNGTWTKPEGKTWALIQCWGGGGSGGRATGARAGGGGGGGAFVQRRMKVSDLGATETVTIGAGGAAVTTANTNGNVGGNTTFGSLVTAYGGGGGGQDVGNGGGGGGGGVLGAGATASLDDGGLGGAPNSPIFVDSAASVDAVLGQGGTGGASVVDGNFNTLGGGGGGGVTSTGNSFGGSSIFGGGGGGAAGSGGGGNGRDGGPSVYGGGGGGGGSEGTTGGAGGLSMNGGNGGAGSAGTTPATAGSVPGGGGGGSEEANSGAGGSGMVIVTCF